MAYETIRVDTDNHITTIAFNRPEARNALNRQMTHEMTLALHEAEADENVRVIILTGSDTVFAAGADITEIVDMSCADITYDDFIGETWESVARCRKPVIAAVAGYALGGGCELALMCDMIIAAESAKFGQPEVNLGIIAGAGGTQRLTHAIGKAKAMEMHLTGRLMCAQEAERLGLVTRIVANDDLEAEAFKTAEKIAEKSLLSTMAIKDCINYAFNAPLSQGTQFERRTFQGMFSTEDQKEGMNAFVEKRKAQFRDK